MADVKAEVNRSIELEELQEDEERSSRTRRATSSRACTAEVQQASADLRAELGRGATPALDGGGQRPHDGLAPPPPDYKHPKKNWRLKRGAMPQWYKQRQGIRTQGAVGRGAGGALPAAAPRLTAMSDGRQAATTNSPAPSSPSSRTWSSCATG